MGETLNRCVARVSESFHPWRRTKSLKVQCRRLDYWLVSKSARALALHSRHTVAVTFSDHSAIALHVHNKNSDKRGPGIWRFNNSSLIEDDDFVLNLSFRFFPLNELQKWPRFKSTLQNAFKTKLEKYQDQKTRAFIFRSKVHWYEHGAKNNRYIKELENDNKVKIAYKWEWGLRGIVLF